MMWCAQVTVDTDDGSRKRVKRVLYRLNTNDKTIALLVLRTLIVRLDKERRAAKPSPDSDAGEGDAMGSAGDGGGCSDDHEDEAPRVGVGQRPASR